MTQEALKLAIQLKDSASGYWTENEIPIIEKLIELLAQTQEPVAYDKTEMNCFVQDLYDKKMQEGKHGHYETMFHVVHQAIKKVPPQRTWVGLTDEEYIHITDSVYHQGHGLVAYYKAIEAKLKDKNT